MEADLVTCGNRWPRLFFSMLSSGGFKRLLVVGSGLSGYGRSQRESGRSFRRRSRGLERPRWWIAEWPLSGGDREEADACLFSRRARGSNACRRWRTAKPLWSEEAGKRPFVHLDLGGGLSSTSLVMQCNPLVSKDSLVYGASRKCAISMALQERRRNPARQRSRLGSGR